MYCAPVLNTCTTVLGVFRTRVLPMNELVFWLFIPSCERSKRIPEDSLPIKKWLCGGEHCRALCSYTKDIGLCVCAPWSVDNHDQNSSRFVACNAERLQLFQYLYRYSKCERRTRECHSHGRVGNKCTWQVCLCVI